MGKRSGGRGRINPALTELDKLELGLSEENTRRPDKVISNRLVADVSAYKKLHKWKKTAEGRGLVEQDGAADPLLELSWGAPKNRNLALLFYFFKLAENPTTIASFEYIDQLIAAGADVNAQDRIGQTLLHEVARDWSDDVADYLLSKGAHVNIPDCQGRTPLHIACRTENDSVVRCLLNHGAAMEALTAGELQTPLHYAARHDAAQVIEVLHEFGAGLNPRDYKGRTPLLLAAELDRSVAAIQLLEAGAKAGIIDKTGLHTLCAMVEKMPAVANKALDQFHVTNRGSRQQFFFLNYLEPDPDIDEVSFLNMSVLGAIVSAKELKLMNHPAIREIIKIKWRKFGQSRCLINLLIYGVYLASWTCVVFIYQPWRLEQMKSGDSTATTDGANIASVCVAVILFLYLLIEEFRDVYQSETTHSRYKEWRSKQIERDLQYVPDKLTEEKEYLQNQAEIVRSSISRYRQDPWNWFDWLGYVSMLITSVCVLTCLYGESLKTGHLESYKQFALWTSRFMCITIVLIWFKLFKYVRVYSFLGPFVVILVNTIHDIIKICFVFVVFFVPTVAVFYQFYSHKDGESFGGVRETIFTVFRMLLVDDYGYEEMTNLKFDIPVGETTVIVKPEVSWTDFLVCYWLLVGAIIILNLFIALMSDTFQRVFDNAAEVALLERATIICNIESSLPDNRKRKFLRYLKEKCAPLEAYYDDDEDEDEEGEVKKFTEQTFELVKTVQSDLDGWKEEVIHEMKSLVAEQVVTQREEISKLQESVRQLTRVLEAQSNFKKGLGQGSGSSGKRSGGRSRSGPRSSGDGKR
ncbi:transient receptor potential cation channel subfamily V member 5-like isoform X2 [Bolinopsis microptera]|uniref:transient receptor potential cation channel subfamily V member 5-like isoform X2 n=1 Tax=Bolinopsis microptera TaxID=2820187 RepID=UPI003079D824